jgi:hypothetical protein
MISDQTQQLLLQIHRSGGDILFVDDEWPAGFDYEIIRDLRKQGFIHHALGNFWIPTETLTLTRKGLAAIGAPIPLTIIQAILRWASGLIVSGDRLPR